MKYLLLSMMISFSAHSFEIERRAVVRDEHFNAEIKTVVLKDLISEDGYEGKFFKIVNGKSEKPISFHDSEELQLKAATTYYHLNKARKYFVDQVKSEYVRDMPQLTIRVELTNVFNELGHFAHDNLEPQFNNALTIPKGEGYEPRGIKPWNIEIWFRPSKVINLEDLGPLDGVSVKSSLTDFRNQTHMTNLQQFMSRLLLAGAGGQSVSSSAIRFVESSIMVELIYQSSDIAAELFTRKVYRLDSALVPEIIYHEFSHVALSDSLELTHSSPVNEGLADYFAGKISNSKKLATKIKDYNLFNGKEVRKKQQYRMEFERGDYANTDFVFGLLWNAGLTVGTDIEGQFMYGVAKKVNTNDSIRDGLINATIESCKTSCHNPLSDRLKLYELYHSKNI
jgi:hypothetical protein